MICRDFKKGLCHNQDCPRAHVLELTPEMIALLPHGKQRTPNVQVPVVDSERIRKSKVELCKLNLVGKCPLGSSCKYSHDLGTETPPSPSPQSATAAEPTRLPESLADTSAPPRTTHILPQKVTSYHYARSY